MTEYIQVGRRFSTYDPKILDEASDYTFLYSGEHSSPYTWEDLLKYKACVIIAEGQSGKTEEFRRQTLALRAGGKFAFYCPLENLLHFKLEDALELGDQAELERWSASESPGWFFLDAVDEVKIQGPKDFERAVVAAVSAISQHMPRAHIIISSRPHAWDSNLDHNMLCRRLGLREDRKERRQASSDSAKDSIQTDDDLASAAEVDAMTSEIDPPALPVFRLAPLTRPQVEEFARIQGVQDPDAFLEAIGRANADVYASRPDDLLGLISLWKASQRIENYTSVVRSNVERKLTERNPRHERAATLSLERAQLGAEQLAAAVTLTHRPTILIPLQQVSADVVEQCIDPRVILPNWTAVEIAELLGRPLFDQSFYGTVRFHHRTAREYLAARWLERLIRNRKHRRSIRNLLLAQPYEVEQLVVRPSLKPVAGWLAQWDPDIRDAILKIDGKVLLEFGDASALPVDVRALLLTRYAERYADRRQTSLSLDLREIQRLSDPRLGPTIQTLLLKHRANIGLQQLLLKIIREGKVSACQEAAASLAHDQAMDTYTRSCAIEAVAHAGTTEDGKRLCQEFLTTTGPLSRRLITTLVTSFFPAVLSVADLLALLAKAAVPKDNFSSGLRYFLLKAVDKIKTAAELSYCLTETERLLSEKPHIDRFCPVSKKNFWLLQFAAHLLKRLIILDAIDVHSSVSLSILTMATHADHIREYTDDVKSWATEIVQNDHLVRHGMFWLDVERAKIAARTKAVLSIWDNRLIVHRLNADNLDDFLRDVATRSSEDDRQLALTALVWIARISDDYNKVVGEIRKAIAGIPALEAALARLTKPSEASPSDLQHQREIARLDRQTEERAEKHSKNREESIIWLKENVSKLGIGNHAEAGRYLTNIHYLYRQALDLTESRSRWAIANWRVLIEDFGVQVAEAFRDYCIGYWRLFEPKLRSDPTTERNFVPVGVVLGLSGLAMEAAANASWAETLSSSEATRAARYALWEMNRLPAWFIALELARPSEVRKVLRSEIVWEFEQEDGSHIEYFTMSRLRSEAPKLREKLRPDVINLLCEKNVRCRPALVAALSGVLSSTAALPQEFYKVVHDRLLLAMPDPLYGAWLAAQLCIDGSSGLLKTTEWIESAGDKKTADERAVLLLNYIWGEKAEGFNSEHRGYLEPEVLLGLIKLLHTRTSLGDESYQYKSGWVSNQDRANRALDGMITLLSQYPGKRSYIALLELATSEIATLSRDKILILAEARAEADADLPAWPSKAIPEFTKDAERTPQSLLELFEMGISRLDDIKFDLEEGDESIASILQRTPTEPELRKYFAGQLREMANGKYGVGSEEELANVQRTDIRLHIPNIDSRLPIEENWTGPELRNQLREQLVGDYMRESTCGIFLLLRRNNAGNAKTSWKTARGGKSMNFAELIDWLSDQCRDLQAANSVINLRVVGIDLTRRST
jgi:hypothetical protein